MILIEAGTHRVASDQVLYPNADMCEVSRTLIVKNLNASKPDPHATIFSKCVKFMFSDLAESSL